MGILLMGMALVYIAVNAVIIALIGWVAGRFTDKPRRWVIGATLVSILIVFGDWLPIWATHHYYCATKAGLSVYKCRRNGKKRIRAWRKSLHGQIHRGRSMMTTGPSIFSIKEFSGKYGM